MPSGWIKPNGVGKFKKPEKKHEYGNNFKTCQDFGNGRGYIEDQLMDYSLRPSPQIGNIVYLKTDPEQYPRIIKEILVSLDSKQYKLGCAELDTWHYEFEFTTQKDILKTL